MHNFLIFLKKTEKICESQKLKNLQKPKPEKFAKDRKKCERQKLKLALCKYATPRSSYLVLRFSSKFLLHKFVVDWTVDRVLQEEAEGRIVESVAQSESPLFREAVVTADLT